MVIKPNRKKAARTNQEKLEGLCRELDIEMDGVRCPATVAAILNGIRRVLGDIDDERELAK